MLFIDFQDKKKQDKIESGTDRGCLPGESINLYTFTSELEVAVQSPNWHSGWSVLPERLRSTDAMNDSRPEHLGLV